MATVISAEETPKDLEGNILYDILNYSHWKQKHILQKPSTFSLVEGITMCFDLQRREINRRCLNYQICIFVYLDPDICTSFICNDTQEYLFCDYKLIL